MEKEVVNKGENSLVYGAKLLVKLVQKYFNKGEDNYV